MRSTENSNRLLNSCAAMLLLACPALGQMVYNVSVYNDATTDGVTLYAVSTSVDNSTGCQAHGSYSTAARLVAPDGTQAVSTSSGMIANTSMPINGGTGDFTALGSVQLYCGCFMHWVGGSGPARTIGVAIAHTSFRSLEIRYDANGRAYCHYKDLFCREGTIPTCVTGDYTESNTPVPPWPSQIDVSWLRVTFAGWQKCFVVSWVGITLPAYCQ